jgi:transposase
MFPQAKRITLVMDNYTTHTSAALYENFHPEEAWRIWNKFDFVYTPIHGSWLNMAEIELQILKRQCLNRHIGSYDELQREVTSWQKFRNNVAHPINWQFTAKDARIKLKRLYPSFHD